MPTKKESTQLHSAGNCPPRQGRLRPPARDTHQAPHSKNEPPAAVCVEDDPPEFPDWHLPQEHRGEERQFQSIENAHVVVFDLETQLSADEVGGWNKTSLMRVSCGSPGTAARPVSSPISKIR